MLDFNYQEALQWLSLTGIAVFAVSGALDAARKEMDILGFMLIGTATGLGGGTLRDILLGRTPVYWVENSSYVAVCMAVTTLTYFIVPLLASRKRAIIWMDAIGLSLFCVTGTSIAVTMGHGSLIAITMGVVTATFGGIIRDVLCSESLILGQRELYVTTTLVGATTYILLLNLGITTGPAAISGFVAAFTLRASAIIWNLSLPAYRNKS